MKTMTFKTLDDWDDFIADNELFDCYDKKDNHIGYILGPDAERLGLDVRRSWKTGNLCAYVKHRLTPELTKELMDCIYESVIVPQT